MMPVKLCVDEQHSCHTVCVKFYFIPYRSVTVTMKYLKVEAFFVNTVLFCIVER